ncbi:hypothetical protein PG985_011192 [Apiospora marii]|uniref:Uncharacterized protein n=1 Tax=Apiospora marii TaxID=335849 RepID=A0ABR1STB0_9PEZI
MAPAPSKMVGNLSTREVELVIVAWSLLESDKIDMDKFVKASGFANLHSARTNWNLIKKKVTTNASALYKDKDGAEDGKTEDNNTVVTPKSKTPAKKAASANTSTKRKRGKTMSAATVDKDDDEDEADPVETPSKKAKTVNAEDPGLGEI